MSSTLLKPSIKLTEAVTRHGRAQLQFSSIEPPSLTFWPSVLTISVTLIREISAEQNIDYYYLVIQY